MNMNKYMVLVIILTISLMGGCTATAETTTSQPGSQDTQTSDLAQNKTNSPSDAESNTESYSESNTVKTEETRNNETTKVENRNLIGKVVTVHGNFLQLDKVELPEKMLESMNRDNARGDGSGAKADGEATTNLASAMTGANAGGGGMRMPGNGRASGGNMENLDFSGEIIDVMIPVGSSITQMSDKSLELSYDNLKKGMVVRIKVDQDMTMEFQELTEAETFYADSLVIME